MLNDDALLVGDLSQVFAKAFRRKELRRSLKHGWVNILTHGWLSI
jgi:hypothetical protein